MLDHLEITVADLAAAEKFYRAALAPLGYELRVVTEARGFGVTANSLDFWLRSGDASKPPPHFAFNCASRAMATRAYGAAMTAGGRDEGVPKLLPHIHSNYFAGFVRDPDGHKVEFVCHANET